jgi:hypothetical protein
MVDTSELWTFLTALLMAFVTYMAMKIPTWKKKDEKHIVETPEEHNLTDTKYLCVGIVDILRETYLKRPENPISSQRIATYYSIFLNTMTAIVRNFRAEVVKNMGGSIIFFFPKMSESSSDKAAFKDILKCGHAMQAAYHGLNQKYHEEHLPPINYKISADCGKVVVVKSDESQLIDITGPTVNLCAKINGKAPPNRMVIGKNLYDMINDSFEDDYRFTKIHKYPPDKRSILLYGYEYAENPYSVYLISRNG